MNNTTQTPPDPAGLTIEHALLSVTIASTNRLIQYDDSCANILKRELEEKYNGILHVEVEVLYQHGNSAVHFEHCACHECTRGLADPSNP